MILFERKRAKKNRIQRKKIEREIKEAKNKTARYSPKNSLGEISNFVQIENTLSYPGFFLPKSHWLTVVWLTPKLSANFCCDNPFVSMISLISEMYGSSSIQ